MAQRTETLKQAQPQVDVRPSIFELIKWNISDAIVMTRRNLTYYVRQPQLVVFASIQPIMFLLLFVYVFGGAIAGSNDSYVQYVLPGILVQSAVFGATQTTIGLTDDLSKGMIDRFRAMPMSRGAVLAGRTIADAMRALFSITIMILVGTLIGFRFENGFINGLLAIGLAVLFSYAFTWISALIGLLVRNPEAAQVAGFIWVFPLVFASSVFVPTTSMPDWLRSFAENQPISQVANGMRYLFSGEGPAIPAEGAGGMMSGGSSMSPEAIQSMQAMCENAPPQMTEQLSGVCSNLPSVESMSEATMTLSGDMVLWAVSWMLLILVIFVPLAVRQYGRSVN